MTYEFKCAGCKKHFSLSLTMNQYSLMRRFSCPFCESEKVRRVISNPLVIYKGSGFYTTDSKTSDPNTNWRKESTTNESPNRTS